MKRNVSDRVRPRLPGRRLAGPGGSFAQEQVKDQAAHEYVVRAITLAVTVQDSKGRFVNNLLEKDFTVYENNKKKAHHLLHARFRGAAQPDRPPRRQRQHGPREQARRLQGRPPPPGHEAPPAPGRDRPAHLRRRPGRGRRQAFDRQGRVPPGPRQDRGLRPDRPQRRRGRLAGVRDPGQEREEGPAPPHRRHRERQRSRPPNRPSRSPGGSTSPSTPSATRSPATSSCSRPTSGPPA